MLGVDNYIVMTLRKSLDHCGAGKLVRKLEPRRLRRASRRQRRSTSPAGTDTVMRIQRVVIGLPGQFAKTQRRPLVSGRLFTPRIAESVTGAESESVSEMRAS
eukprot:1959659-Rhodomonas_salina.2